MRVGFSCGGQSFRVALPGNPTARDFLTLLPLVLAVEDYGHAGKIARLPRALSQRFASAFGDESAGDLCYRVPLEFIREIACAHHGSFASKLAKKASTKHGAIQTPHPSSGRLRRLPVPATIVTCRIPVPTARALAFAAS